MKKILLWGGAAVVLLLIGVGIYQWWKRRQLARDPAPPTATQTNHPVGGAGRGVIKQRPATQRVPLT